MIDNKLKHSIIAFINSKNITKENVTQFMSDCRNLLEYNKENEKYPTLFFYCNWLLHPNIDRNPFMFAILGDLSMGLSGTGKNSGYSVVKMIRIKELINDIINFNIEVFSNSKQEIIFSVKEIQDLICQIFSNLTERKLHFPESKSKNDQKKIDTIISSATQISQNVDNIEKHIDSSLDSNIDYSSPVLIKSLVIKNVISNTVLFEMKVDEGHGEVTLVQKTNINILLAANNQIRILCN